MQDTIFFIGRFHVLALHLPIGILIATVAVDWLSRRGKHRDLAAAVPFLWGATACTAVLTVLLGFMHFSEGGFSGPSAAAHRLYGTSVAVVTVIVWMLSTRWTAVYRKVHIAAGLVLLFLVTMTGHYGGNLTHGSQYLVEYAPQPLRALVGLDARRAPVTDLALADPWRDIVQPMLEARCANCHNDDKSNGDFSVTSYDAVLAGGETGGGVVAGNADLSEVYRRISLPHDDEAFMPAEGKTPLTTEQVAIVRWWIDSGAPIDLPMAEIGTTPAVEQLLLAELGLGGVAPDGTVELAATTDPTLVRNLYEAGFLVRQVSQSDAHLIVSIYSPGIALAPAQLVVLLSAAEHIVHLDLQGAGIQDADLADFGRFTELVSLRLSNNRIADVGVGVLAGLSKLEYLNLYGNVGVTDNSLQSLAGMASLANLYLWETAVSAQGLARLRELRPDVEVQAGATALILPAPTQAAASR